MSSAADAKVDFLMPVYNEGANITRAVEEIYAQVPLTKRVLVVYDFEADNTVPVVRQLQPTVPWARTGEERRGPRCAERGPRGGNGGRSRGGGGDDGRPVGRRGRWCLGWSQ